MTGRQSRAIENLGAVGGGDTSQQANGCDWVICQQITGPRAPVWGIENRRARSTVLQNRALIQTFRHTRSY